MPLGNTHSGFRGACSFRDMMAGLVVGWKRCPALSWPLTDVGHSRALCRVLASSLNALIVEMICMHRFFQIAFRGLDTLLHFIMII